MKKTTLFEVQENIKNGDSFSKWFFTKDEAESEISSIKYHLTPKELASEDITLIEHFVRVPKDYEPKTAQQVIDDLFNGDVESPDYDEPTGYFIRG